MVIKVDALDLYAYQWTIQKPVALLGRGLDMWLQYFASEKSYLPGNNNTSTLWLLQFQLLTNTTLDDYMKKKQQSLSLLCSVKLTG